MKVIDANCAQLGTFTYPAYGKRGFFNFNDYKRSHFGRRILLIAGRGNNGGECVL
jgi:NAD(P)H-hydrate repair Nnr-like enzyme with NAD(P)H-hydrate epimerase domain